MRIIIIIQGWDLPPPQSARNHTHYICFNLLWLFELTNKNNSSGKAKCCFLATLCILLGNAWGYTRFLPTPEYLRGLTYASISHGHYVPSSSCFLGNSMNTIRQHPRIYGVSTQHRLSLGANAGFNQALPNYYS